MYFTVALNKIDTQYPGKNSPLMFELTLRNTIKRVARIHSIDFELWLDGGGAPYKFVGQLRPDFQNSMDTYKFIAEYQAEQQATMRFLWHYTPHALERIEDIRRGGLLNFRLYGQLSVSSTYPGPNSTTTVAFETFMSEKGGYPYCFQIAQSEWARLLDTIGFRHIVLHELEWPPLPPAWTRSGDALKDAWNHHRAGRYEEAMLSCRRALECIAINVTGDPRAKRDAVVQQLFPSFPTGKQQALVSLWGTVQDALNIAVHNNTQPVTWSKEDSELLILCTMATIGRLARA